MRRKPASRLYYREPQQPFPGLAEITHCKRVRTARALWMGVHRHDFLELCLIERGHLQWWVSGRPVQLRGGDAFLIRPHAAHGNFDVPHEPCTYIAIGLETASVSRNWLRMPAREARALLARIQRAPRKLSVPPAVAAQFQRLVELAQDARQPVAIAEARSAMVQILIGIARASMRSASTSRSTVVAQAAALMQERIREPLPLPEIARRLGWSISHLKGRFRREMGVAPAEYFLRQRIAGACQSLRFTKASITAIALEFGFGSSQYFATAFKRLMGTTPQKYRRAR
jgi:AraC-like DNA-binding protein